ncbi:MAG: DUF3795 domain-containing protein [Oscillospiraceae bacterium]|nr:DUF3795 domain-containing protein [Oscillospiraceae bacterium]
MDKRYQTAPCGLDCFNCPAHKENLTDEKRKEVADSLKIALEEVGCKGCRAVNGRCHFVKGECATWACAQKKGVTYCFECNKFPCGLLAPTAQGANYPHNMKVYNLCRMKLLGIDGWIEEAGHIRNRYYNGKFVVGEGPVLETK